MQINFFSVTFWFSIYNNHKEILEVLQENLKDEYSKFSIFNYTDNYNVPIITAFNNEKKTNMSFSQINFQYNMDQVTLSDFKSFKEKVLKLYDILINNGIKILHTSIFIDGEMVDDDAIKNITKKTISDSFYDEDLVDINLKIGKKHEDLFYKIITILNKTQIKLPQKKDENGRPIPFSLISWQEALVEHEVIEAFYEINDKYLFDYTSDYHTTEFYLNKMLYLIEENFESDVNSVLKDGKF